MKIDFLKYQGAGNDFVLIDNRSKNYSSLSTKQIKMLCDRKFGVGADGLMLLQNHPDFDFEMIYYNADGNLGSMCGNGGRCIVSFAKHLNIIDKETNFLAVDGPHYAKISDTDTWVELKMIDVNEVDINDAIVLNTGSPHYVKEVSNLSKVDMFTLGREIRYSETYQEKGINVNFMESIDNVLHVRTYERGVEDETLACGTGVTASAMALSILQDQFGKVETKIKAMGGHLQVEFYRENNSFTEVYLKGPATLVFDGRISVD